MARTPTARLSRNFLDSSRKQILKEIFLFYHDIVCCVYYFESPHRIEDRKYFEIPQLYFLTWRHD